MNLESVVDMTLFKSNLAVDRLDVLVLTASGYSMRSPPTVNRTRRGFDFWGRSATTMRR